MASSNKLITPETRFIYSPSGEKVALTPKDNLLRKFLRDNQNAKPPTKSVKNKPQ